MSNNPQADLFTTFLTAYYPQPLTPLRAGDRSMETWAISRLPASPPSGELGLETSQHTHVLQWGQWGRKYLIHILERESDRILRRVNTSFSSPILLPLPRYIIAQYTRHINPGMTVLSVGGGNTDTTAVDRVIATHDAATGE